MNSLRLPHGTLRLVNRVFLLHHGRSSSCGLLARVVVPLGLSLMSSDTMRLSATATQQWHQWVRMTAGWQEQQPTLTSVRVCTMAAAGALDLGYADFAQIRRDADLAALRSDERFEGLMARFEPRTPSWSLPFFGKK